MASRTDKGSWWARLESVSKRLRLVQAMMFESAVVAVIVALRVAMAVAAVPETLRLLLQEQQR